MTDFCNNSVYFGVAISLVGYVIGVQLKKKFKLAVLNPLMISIIFVVGVVLLFKLDSVIFVEKKFTCSNMRYYFRRFCQYV